MQKLDKIILYVIIVLVLLFFIYLIWKYWKANWEGFEDSPSSNINKEDQPAVWKNIDLIFDPANKTDIGLPITADHLTSKDNSSIYDLEYKLIYSNINKDNNGVVMLYQYYRYFLSGGLSKDQYKTMTDIIIPGLSSLFKNNKINMGRITNLLTGTNITTEDLNRGMNIDQMNAMLKWLSDPANNEIE